MEAIQSKVYTKADVKEILEKHNANNRPINWNTVEVLASVMNEGKFVRNGQGEFITFDKNGNLLNGQHRLNAFLKSNLETIELFTITGIQTEAFSTIDTGRGRSVSQILSISGAKDAGKISRMIKIVNNYKVGKKINCVRAFGVGSNAKRGNGVYTIDDINSLYLKDKDMYDSLYQHFRNQKSRIDTPVLAAAAFILMNEDFGLCYSPEEVFGFLDDVASCSNSRYENISSLITKINSIVDKKGIYGKTSTVALQLDVIADAWNKRKTGVNVCRKPGVKNYILFK